MKKYTFLLLVSAIMICFSACDDNDTHNPTQINTDQKAINLKIDEVQSVKILEGNGNYRIFSLNEDIASITQSEDEPTIFKVNALNYGSTQIVVADAKTKIKTIPVFVGDYDAIKSDSEELIELEGSFGGEVNIEINILEANGNVSVDVSDRSFLGNVVFEDNKLTTTVFIRELKSTEITFTDECNLQLKVTISIKDIDFKPPYSEEEYQTLLNEPSIRYYAERSEENEYLSKEGSRINETEGDRHTYGWKWMYVPFWGNPTEVYKKVSFKGNKEVGIKTEGKIEMKSQWGGNESYDLKHIEIMKVENGRLWCFYSFTNNYGGYSYGYFVDNISAE